MSTGLVLGLNATGLGGAWRCLTCGYYTQMAQVDVEDGSIPTCGQRKTQYCAGPCQNMTNFEWATQGYAIPQKTVVGIQQPAPSSTTSSTRSNMLPVGTVQEHPKLPDLEQFTEDELIELKNQIDAKLKEKKLCSICCERNKNTIFYPCKHKASCKDCSEKLKECPICRQAIQDRIVPY